MTLPRLLFVFAFFLFSFIAIAAYFKDKDLANLHDAPERVEEELAVAEPVAQAEEKPVMAEPPTADRVEEFFRISNPRFPVVETLTYSSKVPWQPGRAAWIADYASHYDTSRHFIARSLNGAKDYTTQNIHNGDRFNVLRTDKEIEFHLVIDLSRTKLWFYYYDAAENSRTLVKTYDVGLGRPAPERESGSLTPLGVYKLGNRFATYNKGKYGIYQGERTEMIQVFGTRWIPFEEEIAGCTEPAKGYGIHGVPWEFNAQDGSYRPAVETIGDYLSDGCIRLATEDIQELFAIIISRPTFVHLVTDFFEAQVPGTEG